MTLQSLSHEQKWRPYEVGLGSVVLNNVGQATERILLRKGRFSAEDSFFHNSSLSYANAQIDDYHYRRRSDFLWRPPVRMKLRARFSHPTADSRLKLHKPHYLTGTAGFGFWNDPFMMTGRRMPTLPRAIWFFYASPPSNMGLALGVPGWGWKAAVIDCLRPAFLGLLPTAPIGALLMRSPSLYRRLWPIAQAAMHVDERLIDESVTDWRTYEIEWRRNKARFWIDDQLVLETDRSPKGPLGMVIWLDNQSMVVTPHGRLRGGLTALAQEEALEIESLDVGGI